MQRRTFLQSSLAASLGAYSVLTPRNVSQMAVAQGEPAPRPGTFPEFAETEFEESTIRIPLYSLGNGCLFRLPGRRGCVARSHRQRPN